MSASERNVAALVGNGMSIAFEPSLNLTSITEEVLRRIESEDGGQVVEAMKKVAEWALPDGASSDHDFELLVGAFGFESRTLGLLDSLAALREPADEDLRDAIDAVARFAQRVRDGGIAHVLEVIAERSHASQERAAPMRRLMSALIHDFDGRISIGNLNYDTLLLAALMKVCPKEFSDLGDGRKETTVVLGLSEHPANRLRRRRADFPKYQRVRLLHLHGSLTYWSDGDTSVKVSLPELEAASPWRAIRSGETTARPLVVLANPQEKPEQVRRHPFGLAYDLFSDALDEADSWLVVGYSFRDESVNLRMQESLAAYEEPPRMLVVTHGDSPSRQEISRALGVEPSSTHAWLHIDKRGAYGLEARSSWSWFTGGDE
ncbi:SIR2 family protein [Microbacterium sp. LWH10-1.2]|uniref:SIR2 family protein n=1 Tax=unclassified Microbacterium TaxID=2609290 RepID=UPI0031392391